MRLFAKKYGLDALISMSYVLKGQFAGPTGKQKDGHLQMDPDIDVFIKYLIKKLTNEQKNRLKTEEQSAQVIE